MKYLFSASLLFIVFCLTECKPKASTIKLNDGLKGKVKSVMTTYFTSPKEQFGDWQSDEIQSKSKTEFNDNGNKTSETLFYANGKTNEKSTWIYSGDSIVIKRTNGEDEKSEETSKTLKLIKGKVLVYKENENGINSSEGETKTYFDDDGRVKKIEIFQWIPTDSVPGRPSAQPKYGLYRVQDYIYQENEKELRTTIVTSSPEYKSKDSSSTTINFLSIDNKGNWTKAVYYINNKPEALIRREIVYY